VNGRFFNLIASAGICVSVAMTAYITNVEAAEAIEAFGRRRRDGDLRAGSGVAWGHSADMAFSVLFLLELGLRVTAHGLDFFVGPEQKWNIFDSIVIAVQLFQYFHGMRHGRSSRNCAIQLIYMDKLQFALFHECVTQSLKQLILVVARVARWKIAFFHVIADLEEHL